MPYSFLYWGYNNLDINNEERAAYFERIKSVFADSTIKTENKEIVPSINDSISRLTEYCDEFDQKFSKNTLVYDVRNVLKENEKLHKQIQAMYEKIVEILCRIPGGKK